MLSKKRIIASVLAVTTFLSGLCITNTMADDNIEAASPTDFINCVNEITSSVDDAMVWDFSDCDIADLIDSTTVSYPIVFNNDITHNGISLTADSQHTVKLENDTFSELQIDNEYLSSMIHTFPVRLNLMGKGRNYYRSLKFTVEQSVDIYVVAESSYYVTSEESSNARHLILSELLNADGSNYSDRVWVNHPDIYKLEYETTSPKTLYLASQQDNIYIYYIAVVPKDTTEASNVRGWDFSETPFQSLNSESFIDGTLSCDDLIINADPSEAFALTMDKNNYENNVKMVRSNNSVNGFKYTQCLTFVGSGDRAFRNFSFIAQKNTDIYITARSNGNDNRQLAIYNEHGYQETNVSSITLTPNIATYKISNTGNTQRLRMFGKDGAIRIYSIYVVPQNKSTTVNVPNLVVGNTFNSGTINVTSNSVMANLHFYGSEAYPITIQTVDDVRVLSANTTPSFYNNGGYFGFDVPNSSESPSNITIKAKSNSEIYIVNAYGMLIGTIPASTEYITTTITYNGYMDELYMYSSGTMHLAEISVANSLLTENAYELSNESQYYMELYELSNQETELYSLVDDDSVVSESAVSFENINISQ